VEHPASALPDTPFGRYHLIERLAVGGMGEVFLARYLTTAGIERFAVVKRILPSLSQDMAFINHFLNEGRITSLLCHPNVVQILELGRTNNQYYIAMEYIPGHTLVRLLSNAMKQQRLLSIPLIHWLASQIVGALEYLHELTNIEGKPLSIIHMDLSPHNIIVTPAGQAKLIDFGISRAAGLRQGSVERDLRGRTAYLAPEQLDELPLDPRVDLFAMGIILHEMILARPLFRAQAEQQTATRILYAPIPRLRFFRPECPDLLEAVAMRALQRNRDQRYQHAREMRADLDQVAQCHRLVPSPSALCQELTQLMHQPQKDKFAPAAGFQALTPSHSFAAFGSLGSTTL
jgi:serine/threonine-protein kinase